MRAVRAISRRRPPTWVSRRSAGRREASCGARGCRGIRPKLAYPLTPAATATPVAALMLKIWLADGAQSQTGATSAERDSFADYGAGCQLKRALRRKSRCAAEACVAALDRPPDQSPRPWHGLGPTRRCMVRKAGLEPARGLRHRHLNPGRLPIPPLSLVRGHCIRRPRPPVCAGNKKSARGDRALRVWWAVKDSNLRPID